MKCRMQMLMLLVACLGTADLCKAQRLNETFRSVFDYFLREKIQLSGGFHGDHFQPAADSAEILLTPALNSLVASNISSFPLSSTVAGVTYDLLEGSPVPITESLGPIFSEPAQTIGRGKLNLGFNYSFLNLTEFRGLPTEAIRFTFIHEDNDPSGLGDPTFENDYTDLLLNLDIDAHISALFATFGITNSLDVGIAIPVVSVSLRGNAQARITSLTYGRVSSSAPQFEGAAHRFGGTLENPILEDNFSYSESATGIGDIGFRMKYNFLRSTKVSMGVLLDIRLPTGNEEDFLGTGNTNARITWIASQEMGNSTSHINFGYERRWSDPFDSDELEFVAGFDQKIARGITLAVEFLGSFDVHAGSDRSIQLFPGTQTITEDFTTTDGRSGSIERNIDLSNVPARDNDNTFDAAIGLRYAPSERVLFLGNLLIPLNDGGLRSSVAPTVGLTVNL